MEPIAKVLFCWKHPLDRECKWLYSLEWYNSPFGDHGRERKMLCLSPHHICESHKKGKGFNSHSWCCLLKGISPIRLPHRDPKRKPDIVKDAKACNTVFSFNESYTDKDAMAIFVKLKPWIDSHLEVQLNCLQGKLYYWMWSMPNRVVS